MSIRFNDFTEMSEGDKNDFFEKVVSTEDIRLQMIKDLAVPKDPRVPKLPEMIRSCRSMEVPEGIEETNPGCYADLIVESGGYCCQWYYYHATNGSHWYIYRTTQRENFHFSARKIDGFPSSFGNETETETEIGLN